MESHFIRNLCCCTVYELHGYASAAATPINLVSNSTFDSGTSGWGKYQESGGSASLSTENGQLALSVSSVGELNYSVQCYYDIVPLYKNGVYHIQYDISSTIDRTIEGMIQQNGGTYQSYSWKQIDLTSTPQTVDYTFTMKKTPMLWQSWFSTVEHRGRSAGA